MMSELNEFFEQILHTERSLSSRNVKLRELKDEIQACVQALHHVREEVETRQGELAVRNVKMVDQEVDARLLDLRLTILEEQKSKLTAANNTMTSELETSKMQLESESEKFLEELKEFGRSYDLVGSGCKHREELIQKRLCTLQDELLLLEAELAEFENESEEVRKLEEKLSEVERALTKKQEGKKALENQIHENETEIKKLREEHESTNSKLSSDPEIIKLQQDLEECKNCPEEKAYHSLQRELEELQRLCYHRQMKQHMPRGKNRDTRQTSRYNPYTRQYMSETRDGGSRTDVKDGRVAMKCAQDDSGVGVETEGGDDAEESWDDDELEAVELASFQEGLGDAEMEWMEDEEEEDSVESNTREGSAFEHREKPQVISGVPSTHRDVQLGQKKYRFIKPSSCHMNKPTPKAIRTVVKRCSKQSTDTARLSCLTDSPMPGTVVTKKPSGQSIYKTPGQHEQLQQVPRMAKKVRFRY